MASKKSHQRMRSEWSSGSPPFRAALRQAMQPNSQPASQANTYLTTPDTAAQNGSMPPLDASSLPADGNLVGWKPTAPAGGPNPMAFQGDPGNLPGIAGGPPAFGSAPVAPPQLTLPKPTGAANSYLSPDAGLPADGNLVGWKPTAPAGGPSPMAFQGDPGNLPGIAGGPPAFGSAPVTPPKLTLPPR